MSVSSSDRTVSGSLPTSVKKRPTLYISETDPRAQDKSFINSYQGLVQVLTKQEYLAWIKKQIPGANGSIDDFGNNEDNTNDVFGTLAKNVPPPTSLKYNFDNPENTKWVVADGQVFVDITIDISRLIVFSLIFMSIVYLTPFLMEYFYRIYI